MKQPHPNPSAKGISRCLLACLILLPLAPAAAQKVVATVSSTKPGGPASTGHPTWLPPDVDEKVPAEETACSVDEVVQKAEERILEFVGRGRSQCQCRMLLCMIFRRANLSGPTGENSVLTECGNRV